MTTTDDGSYDVIVLGAGPAGEVTAGRLAEAGLRVALVERELVGGECSYWGCSPSKTLIRPGDVLAAARRVPGAASAVTDPVDASAVLAWRDEQTGGWDDSGALPWLTERGITLVRGRGRLDGVRTVVVVETRPVPGRRQERRPRRPDADRATGCCPGHGHERCSAAGGGPGRGGSVGQP